MQRLVLWLALLALALLAGFLLVRLRGDDSVPMIPLTPAKRIDTAPDRTSPLTGSIDARPDAAEANPTIEDSRIATLEVVVVGQIGSERPVRVQFRDVDVEITGRGDAEARSLRATTDAQGIARFEVRGGAGRLARATSGPTTTAAAELRADSITRITLTLQTRVLVQGRVVDESGQTIADADLVVLPWDLPGQPARLRKVGRSLADGSFSVPLAFGGRVGAMHSGFAASALYTIPPPTDPNAPPVSFALELVLSTRAASLAFAVVDAADRPIAHAEVELRHCEPPPPGATLAGAPRRHRTDEGGRTTFTDLRPGCIDYIVRRRGHASARGRTPVEFGTTASLVVRLGPACEVHGFVRTPDGTKVVGARVTADAAGVDAEVTTTDAEGAFRLVDLAAGEHRLTAREPGGSTPRTTPLRRTATTIQLTPGQVGNWVAVLDQVDDDGVRGTVTDRDGRPLAAWRVAVRGGGLVGSATTDRDGTFRAPRPGSGLVDVLTYPPETEPGAFAWSVHPGLDPEAAPLTIVVDPDARFTAMRGTVVSTDRAPLTATILVRHHERHETARFQALTDGSIRVTRIPPGTIDVHVEHPGRSPMTRAQLHADASQPIDLGLVVLGEAAVMHGRITGPGGRSPETLEVALQTKDRRILAEYTAGTYRFPALPPGEHQLQIQGPGVAAASFPVRLTAAIDTEQNVELLAGVPRRIVVRTPRRPTQRVYVAVRIAGENVSWNGAGDCRPADDDPTDGVAEFVAFMAPGAYEVLAWTADSWEARTPTTFVAGDDGPVTLVLRPD